MNKDTNPEPISESHESKLEKSVRKLAIIVALSIFAITIIALAYLYYNAIYQGIQAGVWLPILRDHFVTAFGFPISIICSFAIVQILRGLHGPIEIQIFNVKFAGATGPVILWILCVLTTSWVISLLWRLPS